jgi:hypothetical protein
LIELDPGNKKDIVFGFDEIAETTILFMKNIRTNLIFHGNIEIDSSKEILDAIREKKGIDH